MMNVSDQIKNAHQNLDKIVEKVLNAPEDTFKIGQFHTSDLFEPGEEYNNHPNTHTDFRPIVAKLNEYYEDCLYWFQTESVKDAQKLDQLLCSYRQKRGVENSGYRAVPTTNTLKNKDKVLYVGVRKGKKSKKGLTNIMGRINQHLGYYKNSKTQGLQLYHWAKDANVKITIYCVHFEQDLGPLLYVLENKIAQKLQPYCGRN